MERREIIIASLKKKLTPGQRKILIAKRKTRLRRILARKKGIHGAKGKKVPKSKSFLNLFKSGRILPKVA